MPDNITRAEDAELATTLAEIRVALAKDPDNLTASEKRTYDKLLGQAEAVEGEIERRRRLAAAVAAVPRAKGDDSNAPYGSLARVEDASVYFPNSPDSFFRDIWRAGKGDPEASERLLRHGREMRGTPQARQLAAIERRDISIGGGVADFIPPMYLGDQYAPLARARRPLADLIGSRPLPDAGMTLTVPKISTGVTVAAQATEADAISETDATDALVSFGVKTVAGQQDLSQQLFERSMPGMDQVVADDLSRAHAAEVDRQVINGSDASGQVEGILQSDGINAITYTDTDPTVPEIYPKIADGIQRVHALRFEAPNVIVMAPRRWGWFLTAKDADGRPLIDPYSPSNPVGRFGTVAAAGFVGGLQGLPVMVDANVPTVLGASSDEDRILILTTDDLLLYESPVRARVLSEVLSGTLQVRIQLYSYLAFTAERYPAGVTVLSGTGLKPPTF